VGGGTHGSGDATGRAFARVERATGYVLRFAGGSARAVSQRSSGAFRCVECARCDVFGFFERSVWRFVLWLPKFIGSPKRNGFVCCISRKKQRFVLFFRAAGFGGKCTRTARPDLDLSHRKNDLVPPKPPQNRADLRPTSITGRVRMPQRIRIYRGKPGKPVSREPYWV
jgi:hypothetical protein